MEGILLESSLKGLTNNGILSYVSSVRASKSQKPFELFDGERSLPVGNGLYFGGICLHSRTRDDVP